MWSPVPDKIRVASGDQAIGKLIGLNPSSMEVRLAVAACHILMAPSAADEASLVPPGDQAHTRLIFSHPRV